MRSVERVFEFRVDAPIERVAGLLSDVRRLDALTPPWFGLVPIDEGDVHPSRGREIVYRLRWRGLPGRWASRIVEWQLPELFTYEQASGPFVRFVHEHRLSPEEGSTRVVDRVRYSLRGGRWLDRWLVGPELMRIFRFRARAVKRELEASVGALGGAAREEHALRDRLELGHRGADPQIASRAQSEGA